MEVCLAQQAHERKRNLPVKLLAAPGIAVVSLDEWSDLALLPWLGITIAVVDPDFTLLTYTPGIQCIGDAARGPDLLRWVEDQLLRLCVDVHHVSSVCTNNAANVSQATSLHPRLASVAARCLCHVIDIAVKRAAKDPADMEDLSQYDRICTGDSMPEDMKTACAALSSLSVKGVDALSTTPLETRGGSRFSHFQEADDDDDEPVNMPTTQVYIPAAIMSAYIATSLLRGACDEETSGAQRSSSNSEYTTDNESASDDVHDAIATWLEALKGVLDSDTTCEDIVALFDQYRAIVEYATSHGNCRRSSEQARKQVFKEREREYRLALVKPEATLKDYYELPKTSPSIDNDGSSAPERPLSPQPPQQVRELIVYVVRRWSPLLACVCSLLENHEALVIVWKTVDTDAPDLIREHQWRPLAAMASYLDTLDRLTLQAQRDHVIVSDAVYIVEEFKALLES